MTALLLAGLLALPASAAGLKVMSWNIGQVYLGGGRESRADDRDLPRVASVLMKERPDVAALQELQDASQLDRLLALMKGAYRGLAAERSGVDRVTAVLVRAGLSAELVPVSLGRTRPLVAALLPLPEGPKVAVVSLHLDAFDPAKRLQAVEDIFAWAGGLRGPLVLAGDFNLDPSQIPSDQPDHPTWRILVERLDDVGSSAGPTQVFGLRLDHVLAPSAWLSGSKARVIPDARMRWMDHLPLSAELAFRAPPSPPAGSAPPAPQVPGAPRRAVAAPRRDPGTRTASGR